MCDFVGNNEERQWIERIKVGDESAFEQIYKKYYSGLVNFTISYLGSTHEAEEIVQEVFADCWQRRKQLDPTKNIKTYLFQAVKFQSMDVLKHRKVINRHQKEAKHHFKHDYQPKLEVYSTHNEFVNAVHKAIENLPNRAQLVYKLHRKEGLTYNEIAEVMEISTKTVESQMSRALKMLRKALDKFVTIFFIITSFSVYFLS